MKRLIPAFILLALCSSALNAQTAHAGATIQVGSGFSHPNGVAVDAHGNVFVADEGQGFGGAVYAIVAVNGVVSAKSQVNAIGSGFLIPVSVAVDGYGNVFVADNYVNKVYEIVAANGIVTSHSTLNEIGCGFSIPYGVAVDAHGNVFVSDYGHSQIKEIVAVNGLISTASQVNVVGASSNFNLQNGLAVDSSGNVFVADTYDGTPHAGYQEIVAVNGVVSSTSTVVTVGACSSAAHGVPLDASGNIFVASFDGGDVLNLLRRLLEYHLLRNHHLVVYQRAE